MADSHNESEVLEEVLLIKKLFAASENPPVQAVIDSGMCERLVACMRHTNSEVQYNASWVLSNIANENSARAQYVIGLGTVPLWVQHLSCANTDCVDQATWALGTIASTEVKLLNYVREMGALTPLLNIIKLCPPNDLSLLRCAVWAVSRLCRLEIPLPPLDLITPVVPALALSIQHPDTKIALDSLEALSYLSDDVRIRPFIVDSGVVPFVLNIAGHSDTNFHIPALTILGQLACSDDAITEYVIELGSVPIFVQHLSCSDVDCVETATWAIGYMLNDHTEYRDYFLAMGVIPPLLRTIQTLLLPEKGYQPLLSRTVHALSQLCQIKPAPNINHIGPAVPVLAQLIQYVGNSFSLQILSDSLLAFNNLSDAPEELVQVIINTGVVPLIVNILKRADKNLYLAALCILSNISRHTCEHKQCIIDAGCLHNISQHLRPYTPRDLRMETIKILANICLGNSAQIQAIIDAGRVQAIISAIGAYESEIKREAVRACENLAINGTSEQSRYIVECGVLEALCSMIRECTDVKAIKSALAAILAIVKNGADLVRSSINPTNIYVERIQSFQGEVIIKGYLSHSNTDIQSLAGAVMDETVDAL